MLKRVFRVSVVVVMLGTGFSPANAADEIQWKDSPVRSMADAMEAGYQLASTMNMSKADQGFYRYFLQKGASLLRCDEIIMTSSMNVGLPAATMHSCSVLVRPYPRPPIKK
ncbi:MAG: hypothetical protein HQL39_19860 [Alphaproteobacteria bacterium]|nr:hypothetical protein [Alphaproteobacteria bacterium]